MTAPKKTTKSKIPNTKPQSFDLQIFPETPTANVSEYFEGANIKYNQSMKDFMDMGKPDYDDPIALMQRFKLFIEYCTVNDLRITNKVAYFGCGLDIKHVEGWRNGTIHPEDKRFREFINYVDQFCSAYREMLGADNKLSATALTWWQKNYDGMTEEKQITVKNILEVENYSIEEIRKRYLPK